MYILSFAHHRKRRGCIFPTMPYCLPFPVHAWTPQQKVQWAQDLLHQWLLSWIEEKKGEVWCDIRRPSNPGWVWVTPVNTALGLWSHQWGSVSFLPGVLASGGSTLMAQMVKNLPAMRETQVQSLGRKNPLEWKMATHSSMHAWRIPWTEESGRL